METLKRKGNNCEYIKIHFDDEIEYNAVIDCLTRAAMLIGESFSEDIESHLEIVQMLDKTKMVYEDGRVSALIFNDFAEKLFLHCWDLSILTCKHANLYQPEQSNTTEETVVCEKTEEMSVEEPIAEEVIVGQPAVVEEYIDMDDIIIDKTIPSEPIPQELDIPDIEDVIEEVSETVEERQEMPEPIEAPIEKGLYDIIDLLAEETEPEEPVIEEPILDESMIAETIVKDMAMEETSMCEMDVDESVLEELALSEPDDDEELEEEALRKAAFEAEEARRTEEANARAAEIYAKMTMSDEDESRKPNKFMQRFNKLFKK